MIEMITTHTTEFGSLLLFACICCCLAAYHFIRINPRQYRIVVLLDLAFIFLIGSLSAFIRQKLLIMVLWRLFTFMLVPITAIIVGVLLICDGVVMYRREGLCTFTALPVVSGLFMLAIMPPTVLAYLQIIEPPVWLRPVMAYGVLVSFYCAITFMTMATYGVLACRETEDVDCDYIIVHGCGIFGDRITPMLIGRVNKAVELYRKGGCKAKLVVSGGQGPGETISEAEAMRQYLASIDFPAEDLILEDRSTTTKENLIFVREMTENGGSHPRYICVTSDYHAFRTAIYAHRLGMDARGIGSRTALYYRPSASIREYVALMSDAKWLNILLLTLWLMLTTKDFMELGFSAQKGR